MHPQPGGNTTDASGLLGPVSRKQTSSIKVGAQAPGLEEQSSLHSHAEPASEHGQRPHAVSVPIPYPRLLTSKNSEDLDSDDFGLSPGSLPSTYKSHTNLDAASASRPMEGGWLRTREQWLGALSMVLLIVQGTALSLTLRISRSALTEHSHCGCSSSAAWLQRSASWMEALCPPIYVLPSEVGTYRIQATGPHMQHSCVSSYTQVWRAPQTMLHM